MIVTYDANGFYGHPDHIQAHRVTRRAVRSPPSPAPRSARRRSLAVWRSSMRRRCRARCWPRRSGSGRVRPPRFTQAGSVADLPFGVADEQVTTEIDGTGYLRGEGRRAPVARHPDRGGRPRSSRCPTWSAQRIGAREYYTLLAGRRPARAARAGPRRARARICSCAVTPWLSPARIACSAWTARQSDEPPSVPGLQRRRLRACCSCSA